MKKFLLYTLVVIKNATIIIPFFEGMISALVKMIEQDNQKKENKNVQIQNRFQARDVEAKVKGDGESEPSSESFDG